MASWVRESARTAQGIFDEEEQIESPAGSVHNSLANITDQDFLDRICLDASRAGRDTKGMAKALSVSIRTIERRIKRAQLHEDHHKSSVHEPRLAIVFPVNDFTPTSSCAHPDPIPDGDHVYCPSCHKTGVEGHAALRIGPGDYVGPTITKHEPEDGVIGGTESKRKPKSAVARKRQRAAV